MPSTFLIAASWGAGLVVGVIGGLILGTVIAGVAIDVFDSLDIPGKFEPKPRRKPGDESFSDFMRSMGFSQIYPPEV